jgi:hypothetical protein
MPDLETLLRRVSESETTFYTDLWRGAKSFGDLPIVTAADFARTPLLARRYKDVSSLGRICEREGKTYAWEWALEDIREEKIVCAGRKPAVIFTNHHDALFFSVLSYEQGSVPLIGEREPESTLDAIRAYGATDLFTDMRSLEKVSSLLLQDCPVQSVVVFGTAFDFKFLRLFTGVPIRAALFVAEAGILAASERITSEDVVFEPAPGVVCEYRDSLHVTRTRLLVTPIIRMDTGLKIRQRGERTFSLVQERL